MELHAGDSSNSLHYITGGHVYE